MKINDRMLSRSDLLQRVSNIHQLGGTRRYILNDGRSKGIEAVEFDTGAGFRFCVLPDRGLDISLASFKGTNLVYLTSNGEVHPAYFEPPDLGWLRTFFGGLLTTCGLTFLGPPGKDGEEELGCHGRYTTSPAFHVCDKSRWESDEYVMEVSGVVEEAMIFGDKIRLTRSISSRIGTNSLVIRDVAENFGYKTSPFTILYHINPGFPLLDAGNKLALSAKNTSACDENSGQCIDDMLSFTAPIVDFKEQNFLHTMACDSDGKAYCAMINPKLALALYVRWDVKNLPFMNEWKDMNAGDYVVGMEPCNVPCEFRGTLREQGLLQHLEPGESREMEVEIGVLDGQAEIDAFIKRVVSISGEMK